jgi:hypothetical protein
MMKELTPLLEKLAEKLGLTDCIRFDNLVEVQRQGLWQVQSTRQVGSVMVDGRSGSRNTTFYCLLLHT